MAAMIARVGKLEWSLRSDGTNFEYFIRAIIYQQLSGKAASTIHGRFVALFGKKGATPRGLLKLSDEQLRGAGISRQKAGYLRDLAQRLVAKELELDGLHELDDAEIIEAVVAVKGNRVWTAQMFLMFRLGRPDVLPAFDLGIQKGAQLASRCASGQRRNSWRRWATSGAPTPRWHVGTCGGASIREVIPADPGAGRLFIDAGQFPTGTGGPINGGEDSGGGGGTAIDARPGIDAAPTGFADATVLDGPIVHGHVVGRLCAVHDLRSLTPCVPLTGTPLHVHVTPGGGDAVVAADGSYDVPSTTGGAPVIVSTSTTDPTYFGSAASLALDASGNGESRLAGHDPR